jgi:hypothetical protein
MRKFSRARRALVAFSLPLVVVGATVTLTASPAAAATTGSRWLLDEPAGSSTAEDSLGNADGKVHGPVVSGLPGFQGGAFSFPSAAAWVEVANQAALNPGTSDFSYSAYVKLTTVPTTSTVTYDVVRKGLSTTKTGEFKIEVIKGGRIRCTAKDSDRNRVALVGPSSNVGDGRWHHIACSRTGNTWRVTVDSASTTKQAPLKSISNSLSLSIGGKYGKQDNVPGLVDDVELTIG